MSGGKRTGAGRKKGFAAKSAEEARHILSEMVMQEIEPIGKVLIEKAKNGEMPAIKELLDRTFGRAPQAISVTTEKENKAGEYNEDIQQLSMLMDEIMKMGLYGDTTVPEAIAHLKQWQNELAAAARSA